MSIAVIALIIVIRYKAKLGEVEYGIIKGTKIFGYIVMILGLLGSFIIILLSEDTAKRIAAIIDIAIETIILINLINITKTAEKLARKGEERWW